MKPCKKPYMRGEPFGKNFPIAMRFMACCVWAMVGFSAGTASGTLSGIASLMFIVAMLVELVYS